VQNPAGGPPQTGHRLFAAMQDAGPAGQALHY
jgi:hypothetical protein